MTSDLNKMSLVLSMTCARLSWSEEGVTVHGLKSFAGREGEGVARQKSQGLIFGIFGSPPTYFYSISIDTGTRSSAMAYVLVRMNLWHRYSILSA